MENITHNVMKIVYWRSRYDLSALHREALCRVQHTNFRTMCKLCLDLYV